MIGKLKIIFLASATFISLLLIVTQYTSSINQTNSLQSTYVSVIEIDSVMLKLIRLEKDFLLQKKPGFSDSFNETYKELENKLQALIVQFNRMEVDAEPLRRAVLYFNSYQTVFNQLADAQLKLGFNYQSGFLKKLNNLALDIEEGLKEIDNDMLMAHFWTIRRYEQAFLMERTLDFQKQLSSRVQLLDYAVLEQDLSQELSSKLKSQLIEYENTFNLIVNEYQVLGLNHNSGLKAQLKETEHKTELALSDILEILRNTLKEHIKEEQIRSLWQSAFLTIIIVVLIFLMMLVIKNNKVKPEEMEDEEVINNPDI